MSDPQTARDAAERAVLQHIADNPPTWRADEDARYAVAAVLSALGIPPDAPLPLPLRRPVTDVQIIRAARAMRDLEPLSSPLSERLARAALAAAVEVGDA